jgi:tRNA-Thr(GGU) m(6)t(6)A37 methyltransferase TsaA
MGSQSVIEYVPIGVIHTPFSDTAGMPIQPVGAVGIRGTAEVRPEFASGLADLAGFTHVILLYHFHRAAAPRLTVTPFLDSVPRGVFATRAPCRPNPIGLSIVKLLGIDGTTVHLEGVDILDGTPLLDIKPYIREFDERQSARGGWVEQARGQVRDVRADGRFA